MDSSIVNVKRVHYINRLTVRPCLAGTVPLCPRLTKMSRFFLILSEDFFLRDDYDFGTKSGKSETDFK